MREGKSAAAASAGCGCEVIGDFLDNALDGIETDLGVALIVVTEEDAAVIGSPLRVLDIAVEFIGERVRIGAVAIHEVQLGSLMALVAIIVSGVGDPFAVRRDFGRIVGTFAAGQRAKRAIGDAEFIDFGVLIFVIGFRIAIDGSDQIFAIGCPGSAIGAEFIAAIREIAVGDLTRGAALTIDDEELHVTGFEIARTIETIDQTIVGGGRIGPFRAGRRRRKIGDMRALA